MRSGAVWRTIGSAARGGETGSSCNTSGGRLWSICRASTSSEGSAKSGSGEKVLHKGNGAEPQDLDPHIVTGVTEHHLIMSLLEGLVTEDAVDLHPVPGVAEKWDVSPDGLVYTFHLRKNAKWSNGEKVTAKDFLESYKRILTPTLASQYAYMHFMVKNAEAFNQGKLKDFSQVGYQAIDDFTFQIIQSEC